MIYKIQTLLPEIKKSDIIKTDNFQVSFWNVLGNQFDIHGKQIVKKPGPTKLIFFISKKMFDVAEWILYRLVLAFCRDIFFLRGFSRMFQLFSHFYQYMSTSSNKIHLKARYVPKLTKLLTRHRLIFNFYTISITTSIN